MSEKRVLLIESGQFIGGVIYSLFAPYEHLSVTEAAPNNVRELLQALRKARPEIVVLDDTVCLHYLPILLRFMQGSDAQRGIRVVVVHADRNEVEVYEKQHIPVKETADFFAIL